MMAYEDFTLAKMELEKRAAVGGRKLTESEISEVQRLQKQITDLQKKYDDYVSANQGRESEVALKEALARLEKEAKSAPKYHPKVLAAAEKFASYMDGKASEALARIKARREALARGEGSRGSGGPSTEELLDYATVGAAKLTRGIVDAARWASEMKAVIGDWIKPHLDAIRKESESLLERESVTLDKTYGQKMAKSVKKVASQKEELGEISAKIKAKADKGEGQDITYLVQRLARKLVVSGIRDRNSLVEEVHRVLTGIFPDISRSDTIDAICGYGKFKQLSKDEISLVLRDLKGQLQQVRKLEDMARGEAPKKTGIERRTPSDEERRLIKQVEEAKRRGGYNVTDPESQLRTSLQAVKTRLENEIKDLEHQISTRQKIVRHKTAIQYDEAANRLKLRRDELKKQYDEIFPRDRQMTDAQRLAAWKSRTKARIDELNERRANKDFSKRPAPRPIPMDSEANRIKVELERAKMDWQRGLLEDTLKNKKWWERAQDTFLRWYRGGILSSPVVFAKLTAAAAARAALTPLEELSGAAIGKALPRLSAQAPRHGGGMNLRAEAKAIAQALLVKKEGLLDAWDILTKGESQLDVLYGRGREGALGEMDVRPFSVADIPGRTHGAWKAPTKRAEFERSLEKRLTWYAERGVDISDPAVKLEACVGAYKDAERAIFLQDNRVVSAYQAGLRRLEQPAKGKKVPEVGLKLAGTFIRANLPIIRVPSNIVAETAEYVFGSVLGSAKAAKAYTKGIADLAPEDADIIMRQLKKGSIGGAALAIGFLLPNMFGGFYQEGEKRKSTDVKPGQMRVDGVDVSQKLLHHPVFETIQFGNTVRRIADKNQKEEWASIPIGLRAGALGLAEELPFIDEMKRSVKMFSPSQQAAYWGELSRSIAIPQAVQFTAAKMDKAEKRKPKTFLQHIQVGIPVMREQVPEFGRSGITPLPAP